MKKEPLLYFQLFRKVCSEINASLDLGQVLKLITQSATEILETKGCAIFLLDKRANELKAGAHHGLSDTYMNKGPLDAEKSMIDCLYGRTVFVRDATHDPNIQYPDAARKEGVASIISEPMKARNQLIGVIRIYTAAPREFSEMEREFISGLADIGGIAIENARMYSHLEADYQNLINDVHQWFDYGSTH